jgi:hypothetical protein
MKHSPECLLLPLRELVALAQALLIPVPQSLLDRVSHLPALPAAKTATTTLQAAMTTTTQTTAQFAAPTIPVQPGDVILVDSEAMYVQAVLPPQTPTGALQTVQVIRGVGGGSIATHAAAAPVSFVTLTAAMLVKDLIHLALVQRSDTRTGYAWPYPATPPSWITKPNQIGGPAGAIAMSSEQAGAVIPAAPSTGTPNPSPPPSGPAQPDGGA